MREGPLALPSLDQLVRSRNEIVVGRQIRVVQEVAWGVRWDPLDHRDLLDPASHECGHVDGSAAGVDMGDRLTASAHGGGQLQAERGDPASVLVLAVVEVASPAQRNFADDRHQVNRIWWR